MIFAWLIAFALSPNLDDIYSSKFQYIFPRSVIESFWSGQAFDNHEKYTADEIDRLDHDFSSLTEEIFSRHPVKAPIAVITAGAPGAGKTWLMRARLDEHRSKGVNYAYTDPDDVCLKSMHQTWGRDLSKGMTRQDAYNKWRPASNAFAHTILANLIRDKYAFYFGTTASSPHMASNFKYFKSHGYRIHLLHVTAPDDVRWKSICERDKTFVQTTEEDIREKQKLIPQRIKDTYLKYADTIEFYYRWGVHENAVLAATWRRGGHLDIRDQAAYDALKNLHNTICDGLNNPSIRWENSVENLLGQ